MYDTVPPPVARKRRGCLYGCIAIVIVLIILIVAAALGAYMLYGWALESFTAAEPIALPEANVTPNDVADLDKRIAEFQGAAESPEGSPTLVLDSQDLNALLVRTNPGVPIEDWVYLEIKDDKLVGQVSVPLDQALQLGGRMEGRYLNGEATFDVFVRDGRLHIYLIGLAVKGNPMPEEALRGFSGENLAANIHDPQYQRIIDQLESIEVKDGKMIIRLKSTATAEKPPAEAPATEQ